MSFTIRAFRPGDETRVVEMTKRLITHLGEAIDNFDAERYLVDALGPEPQFSLFVAETEKGELVGYVSFHDAYEPSYAERGVYVMDLYVESAVRGEGIGTLLLQAVARDAHERGRSFIWLVTSSDAARLFYNQIMNLKSDVTAYAVAGEKFKELLGR